MSEVLFDCPSANDDALISAACADVFMHKHHHISRNSWIRKNEGLSKEISMVKLLHHGTHLRNLLKILV
jgi:hypothetical protein